MIDITYLEIAAFFLNGQFERWSQHERTTLRWEATIIMDVKEIMCPDVDWIGSIVGLLWTHTNLRFQFMVNFLLSWVATGRWRMTLYPGVSLLGLNLFSSLVYVQRRVNLTLLLTVSVEVMGHYQPKLLVRGRPKTNSFYCLTTQGGLREVVPILIEYILF